MNMVWEFNGISRRNFRINIPSLVDFVLVSRIPPQKNCLYSVSHQMLWQCQLFLCSVPTFVDVCELRRIRLSSYSANRDVIVKSVSIKCTLASVHYFAGALFINNLQTST